MSADNFMMKSGRVISGEEHKARAEAQRLIDEARAEAARVVEDARQRASQLENEVAARVQQLIDDARAEEERFAARAQHARVMAPGADADVGIDPDFLAAPAGTVDEVTGLVI